MTTADGDDLKLLCISTEGEKKWERTVGSGNETARGDEGNSASNTPATDGKYVVTVMSTGHYACYDMQGQRRWGGKLQDRFGEIHIQFGYTASPVIHGDKVYLQMIHGQWTPEPEAGRVVCLNLADGDLIWERPRETGAMMECKHAYTSPIVYDNGDDAYLVTHGADYAIAYDLLDGREVWRCGGMNPHGNYHETLRFVASPGASANLIVLPTAKNGAVLGITPHSRGDITETTNVKWRREQNTPDVPSPLIHDDIVYLCRENGNLLCLDAATGEELYEKRTVRDRHRASPVYADGHVYLTARNGTVTVVKAGRSFELAAQNQMGEEMTASPAIADGTLYLRTFAALYAIRNGQSGG